MALKNQANRLKKREESIYKVNEKLKNSEEKYRLLVENSNDAIFIAQDGRLKYSNKKTSDIFGYSGEELKKVPFIEFIHPEDREIIIDKNKRRFNKNPNLPTTESFRVINKDRSEYIVQLSSVFIEWEGKPATLNFLRDITDQIKLEKTLYQAQKMEAIGTLEGGVAHDFNNLLMGIQGRVSLMLAPSDPSEVYPEHLNAIEEYIQSATNLTKQLLGVAQGGKYNPKPLDLNELMINSSSMFLRTKKEIQIHTKASQTPVVVEVDKRQIEQVLLNLYVNAWQAMPDGGELYLETSIVKLDEAACKAHQINPGPYGKTSVTDTGVGMDEATMQQIFDPFFTTKDKGRGTGLGLASAYGIVKNHGGMITVYSEPGYGATFNIYLPKSEKEIYQEIHQVGELIQGSETVLLVDDEKMIIDVGKSMLERLGYGVIVANGGEQAIHEIKQNGDKIDLVILDLIMPGMDGGKTFDQIQEIKPQIPVMLSSAYAINGQATEIMNRGCNGFIQKPFKISELSQNIRKILDYVEGPA